VGSVDVIEKTPSAAYFLGIVEVSAFNLNTHL
jgi:hypothetical protein